MARVYRAQSPSQLQPLQSHQICHLVRAAPIIALLIPHTPQLLPHKSPNNHPFTLETPHPYPLSPPLPCNLLPTVIISHRYHLPHVHLMPSITEMSVSAM